MPITAIIDPDKITGAYYGKFKEVTGLWVHSEDLSIFVPNEAVEKARLTLNAPSQEDSINMLMSLETLYKESPDKFGEKEVVFVESFIQRFGQGKGFSAKQCAVISDIYSRKQEWIVKEETQKHELVEDDIPF